MTCLVKNTAIFSTPRLYLILERIATGRILQQVSSYPRFTLAGRRRRFFIDYFVSALFPISLFRPLDNQYHWDSIIRKNLSKRG
jgi:hypothetical protein